MDNFEIAGMELHQPLDHQLSVALVDIPLEAEQAGGLGNSETVEPGERFGLGVEVTVVVSQKAGEVPIGVKLVADRLGRAEFDKVMVLDAVFDELRLQGLLGEALFPGVRPDTQIGYCGNAMLPEDADELRHFALFVAEGHKNHIPLMSNRHQRFRTR